MPEMKTYTGGCHCGAVRYEVRTDLSQVIACNCSICTKRGSMLTFVPEDQFKLLMGEGILKDYQFNHKVIHHLFCPTCGIESFAKGTMPDGKKMAAINVRCLDGVDLNALKPTPFDGRSL
ncbi:MAG TPA: GFA family protein [Alphaproteobacteria bacterium]|nr:GFA family protein [Alphaproteobacteria bacterium]